MRSQKLALDPNGHRINCCSFQQDAIMTYGDYQYVVMYVPCTSLDANSDASGVIARLVQKDIESTAGSNKNGPRVTTIARRHLTSSKWDSIAFQDYVQTKDDGHNVISMGISGDGIIHMAWDMHGDEIHYRQSKLGLANGKGEWAALSFSKVLTHLESDSGVPFVFDEITYPRFQTVANGDMLLEFREGRSGLGDCALYRFSCSSHKWTLVASPYIKGVGNNAYLHGFDYKHGVLHVTWTYRDFVEDRKDFDESASKETSQAGPNGPENNHDLHYIYSPDEGKSWYNSASEQLVLPVDVNQDTLAVQIPKYSGIMNQEGQCVDDDGWVHVIGREHGSYYHYYRNPGTKEWHKRSINQLEAKLFGARGKLFPSEKTLYALLPLEGENFVILTLSRSDGVYDDWEVLEKIDNLDGEPLVDRYSNSLSILQREARGDRHIVLLTL